METTSFVLGMLTIIGLVFLAAVVLGMVKIYTLIKRLEDLEEQIVNDQRNYNHDQERLDRRIEEYTSHIHERISSEGQENYTNFEQQRKEILSYVDSRFDKLQTKPKEAIKTNLS
jgi:biopolymer transport protein ExbB/TolQ